MISFPHFLCIFLRMSISMRSMCQFPLQSFQNKPLSSQETTWLGLGNKLGLEKDHGLD